MERIDPDLLRAYARRDWGAPERMSRKSRASAPLEEKVGLAIALYEAARRSTPGWPTDADRWADLQAHLKLKALMDEVGDAFSR